jgi:sucrose phosphorylase
MRNGCQLITYPDRLGGDLRALGTVLRDYIDKAVVGVHILPFFPSSADRGFAPLTYREVDPAFGTWTDLEEALSGRDFIVDFMFNHISRRSEYFQDFVRHHDRSQYRGLFIRYKDFWPGGEPSEEDLSRIYTRKPRPPYLEVEFDDGTTEKVWCTFDYEQIDLNMRSETGRQFVRESLEFLCRFEPSLIRLDAFAYAAKRPGTSCFFVEPDVWELLNFAQETVAPYGAALLPEVHEHHTMQQRISDHGYWVYDFALPMLVLQAIYDGNGSNLTRWLASCPRRQVTTLDTHDGIGVVDVRGLMSDEDIDRTKENLFGQGASAKRIYNTPTYNNLDIYQINCTYYSALGNDDDAYILARAIQLFAPGVPQVYYVGLLAGPNDVELVEETKIGRDINRHNYTPSEIEREFARPVVRRLLRLMEFRNSHPAFGSVDSPVEVETRDKATFTILRRSGDAAARLDVDLASRTFRVFVGAVGSPLSEVAL